MYSLTIQGASLAELKSNLSTVLAALGTKAEKPETTETVAKEIQKAVGTTATVSAPKTRKAKAEEAPAEEPEAPAEEDEDDGLGGGAEDEVTYTRDDVRELLVQVRDAFPDDKAVVKTLVGKFGAKSLGDVEDKDFGALVEAAKEKLASKKKGKK